MKGQKQTQNPNDTQQDESGSGSSIKKPLPTCNALRFLSSMLSKEGAYRSAIRSLRCRLILGERLWVYSPGVHEHLCDSAERLLILKRRNIAQLMPLVELTQ